MFFLITFLTPIFVVHFTRYPVWLQIIIAYIVFEAISIISMIVAAITNHFFDRLFYFLIDVEPSVGGNPEEAKTVLLVGGELFKLLQKLERHIEDWDVFDDTDRLVSLYCNWRQKIFFNPTQRVSEMVREFQRNYHETGEQPTSKLANEILAKIKNGKRSFIEKAVTQQWSWNAIMALCIIIITTLNLHQRGIT